MTGLRSTLRFWLAKPFWLIGLPFVILADWIEGSDA